MLSKANESTLRKQRTLSASNKRDQNVNNRNDNPLEQHMFVKAEGAIIDREAIIHLGHEDLSDRVVKQVVFDDASNAQINGFLGIGCKSVAIQIAANHLERQTAQDRSQESLEMQRLAIQMRQLELELQRLQFEREKLFLMNKSSNIASDQSKNEDVVVQLQSDIC